MKKIPLLCPEYLPTPIRFLFSNQSCHPFYPLWRLMPSLPIEMPCYWHLNWPTIELIAIMPGIFLFIRDTHTQWGSSRFVSHCSQRVELQMFLLVERLRFKLLFQGPIEDCTSETNTDIQQSLVSRSYQYYLVQNMCTACNSGLYSTMVRWWV